LRTRKLLFAILGVAAVSLVLLVGYSAQTGEDRPRKIIEKIHDRVSCVHPQPGSEDC
jgi:hypothetical protein